MTGTRVHVLLNVTTDERQRPAIFTRPRSGSPIAKGDTLQHVHTIEDVAATLPDVILEYAFMITNADRDMVPRDDAERIDAYRAGFHRSVSAGDVLVIEADGALGAYVVNPVGMARVALADYAVVSEDERLTTTEGRES